MLTVKYGTQTINFSHQVNDKLKNAYIYVDFYQGVILRSPPVDEDTARKLVYKKGSWIIQKLKLVEKIPQGDIRTGSRILYLGKRFYVSVNEDTGVKSAVVLFSYSKFTVKLNPAVPDKGKALDRAFEKFTRRKADEKITPRIKYWSNITGLKPAKLRFRKLSKRWGSCTKDNEVIINYDAVKLPFTLIDYVIVHELSHIKYKDHSKAFWNTVEKYIPDYKELDDKMVGMKL